jgi:hypothetical protein
MFPRRIKLYLDSVKDVVMPNHFRAVLLEL